MTSFSRLLKLFAAPTGKLHIRVMRHQLVRFVLVGIGNTSFSYGAYVSLLLVGLEYQVASLLALVLGIAVSFITQGTLVFRNATRITLAKFVVAWMLIYLFNISIIAYLMRTLLNAYWAGAIATIPVTLASYFVLKFAVFGHGKLSRPAKPTR